MGRNVVSAISNATTINVYFFPIFAFSMPNTMVPGMVPKDITANMVSDCCNVKPNPPEAASAIMVGFTKVPTIKL